MAAGAGVEIDGGLRGASGLILLRCGMDRETLEKNLIQAGAHIAQGQKQIAVQRRIIAALEQEAHHHDTVMARNCSLLSRELKQCTSPTAIELPGSPSPR